MSNNTEIDDDYDDDTADITDEETTDMADDEVLPLTEQQAKGLLKRREIDDLLEKRRLEKELRDSFDDLDDDYYDDFD